MRTLQAPNRPVPPPSLEEEKESAATAEGEDLETERDRERGVDGEVGVSEGRRRGGQAQRRRNAFCGPVRIPYQVKHRTSLDVVLLGGFLVIHLLSGEDEPLLDGWDPLLLLHPLLDARDRVVALNVDLDLLASQRFYLDLPPSRGQVSVQGVAKTWLRGAARTFMARKRWLDGLRGSQSATCTGEAHSSGSWQFF